MAPSDVERDLTRLEAELKQLEAEYNMFFAGRLPTPPWESRSRVEALVKRLDRTRIQNTGIRFRFSTLQARFAKFVDLWDRGQRAREEGRQGPFAAARTVAATGTPESRTLRVTALHDPAHERKKLQELYDTFAAARREAGVPQVPFGKFEALVKSHVDKMHAKGTDEVAFRVAIKDGKVNFTARGMKKGRSRAGDHAGPDGDGESNT